MKYLVTIEETISDTFEVIANSFDEAQMIAEHNYRIGKFVLEPGNLISKQMQILNPLTNEHTKWTEF